MAFTDEGARAGQTQVGVNHPTLFVIVYWALEAVLCDYSGWFRFPLSGEKGVVRGGTGGYIHNGNDESSECQVHHRWPQRMSCGIQNLG